MLINTLAVASTLLSALANASPLASKNKNVIAVISCPDGYETVTASSQVVTYAAHTTHTVGTKTCTEAGYCAIGTSVTYVSKPTTIPYKAPQVIYESCPYSSYQDVFSCPSCTKNINVSYCQLGYCVSYNEERKPKPVPGKTKKTTYTTVTSTHGGPYTSVTAYPAPPKYTTTTSYFPYGKPYTSTRGSAVVVGYPKKTVTITYTIPATAKPYTSTIPQKGSIPCTVAIGKPYPKKPHHPVVYTTTTVYLSSGEAYISTLPPRGRGPVTIVYADPVATTTVTSTLTSDAAPYTSTVTQYGTVPGTVIVGVDPLVTSISYLDPSADQYTTTISGTVYIGIDDTISTTTIPYGSAGFTTTLPASGTAPPEVLIETPAPPPVTTTVFGEEPILSTSVITGNGFTTVEVFVPQTTTTETLTSGTVGATITVAASGTVPGTVEILQPTAVACNNQGFQFGFYTNPYFNADPPTYSAFDPTYVENQTPFANGFTDYLGLDDQNGGGDSITIYGVDNVPSSYLIINHRGYLFAKQSGVYTFSTPASDDITLVWVGPDAYSGFTRANAAIDQGYLPSGSIPQTYTIALVQGQYVAVRIIYGNGQGDAQFDFTITAPDGSVIIDSSSTSPSPFLVQYSCDGTSPAFPPYGSE